MANLGNGHGLAETSRSIAPLHDWFGRNLPLYDIYKFYAI
jgi:hypothetical protein